MESIVDNTIDGLNSRLSKLEQLQVESARRTEKIEQVIELWRSQFQNLENTLVRVDSKIEHIQRDVSAFSNNGARLIQVEERLAAIQKDIDSETIIRTQHQNLVYGAVATTFVSVIVAFSLAGAKVGLIESPTLRQDRHFNKAQ